MTDARIGVRLLTSMVYFENLPTNLNRSEPERRIVDPFEVCWHYETTYTRDEHLSGLTSKRIYKANKP